MWNTALHLRYIKSSEHLFPFHCHRTHFTAPMPGTRLQIPRARGQTVFGSRRDNICTEAKNISLRTLREGKCYLSKSWMLVNILSFLHARSKLLQDTSAACEGTGQASKLSPALRKHARLYALQKKLQLYHIKSLIHCHHPLHPPKKSSISLQECSYMDCIFCKDKCPLYNNLILNSMARFGS